MSRVGPNTAKPPRLSTGAANIRKRGWLSLAIYVKRLKILNREYRSHRLAPVWWEEEQLSELVPPVVAGSTLLATSVPARTEMPAHLGTI